MLSGVPSPLPCEELAQINELEPLFIPLSSRSSHIDQFERDALSASDGVDIGGATLNAQGFQSSYQGIDSGACERSESSLGVGLLQQPPPKVLGEYRGHEEQVAQAPANPEEADVVLTLEICSEFGPPSSGAPARHGTIPSHQGDPSTRDTGVSDHPLSPPVTSKATLACSRDSVTRNLISRQDIADIAHGSLHSRSQSAEHTASCIPSSILCAGSYDQDSRNNVNSGPSQQGQRVSLKLSDGNLASALDVEPPHILPIAMATIKSDNLADNCPPTANASSVEPEINTSSTPPMARREPTLASPVTLEMESNIFQSTPPSSPMKLSSPPSLRPPKKANRIHTGLGAPFRNPIRCGLPTSSPLPPSSPPPMPTSSPPAKKRHRVDSDSEEQVNHPPIKYRRTAQQGTSAPFVSPLRNGTRSKLPPAGGFSTPLRSRTHHHNFSSPILPSQPDVFTTPATTARSSPAYRQPIARGSSPVSDSVFTSNATPASSSYSLRPPRTVTRPFKPPAKSTRPTTATVQALRQRLQLLRSALRIKGVADPTLPSAEPSHSAKAADDDELEELSIRWRSAAREAAQDLWTLVRDTMGEDSWASSSNNKQDSWGWATKPQARSTTRLAEDEGRDSDDVTNLPTFSPPPAEKVYQGLVKKLNRPFVPRKTMLPPHENAYDPPVLTKEAEDEPEEPKHQTLGTMLTSLGIPHEVLGWNEEEGEFVD